MLDLANKMRAKALFTRIEGARFDPTETAKLRAESAQAWAALPGKDEMFSEVESLLKKAGKATPELSTIVLKGMAAPVAPVVVQQQQWAPPAIQPQLMADLQGLNLGGGPANQANLNPFADRGFAGPVRAGTASTTGTVENVEFATVYAPSERAEAFMQHYEETKDGYAAMGQRKHRFRMQEFTRGTPSWRDAADALYVLGSIALDQLKEAEEPVEILVKGYGALKDEKITSQAALVAFINGPQKKVTPKPAFSSGFQTDTFAFLREFKNNETKGKETTPISLFYIGNGQDNDNSMRTLKALKKKLSEYLIPETSIAVQAPRVGDSTVGAEKLRKLDDHTDEDSLDFFDTEHWPSLDPDGLATTKVNEDGEEVDVDLLQKTAQAGHVKDLD